MSEWAAIILDAILIVVVGVGIFQAIRLISQLRDLRASRAEMERFVRDFNNAVLRAEAGIKMLRAAARESGDDLEKLVQKAGMVRDELNFIVDSADGVAERLSASASNVLQTDKKPQAPAKEASKPTAPVEKRAANKPASPPAEKPDASPPSRAEQELLQALQKLS
ncbi:MAG: DUF6468 domain-containing protein [Alphaproteobacteria bacterium]|nr:DUF6468 domain-containing protein [Alphaproteobacteria bacterium]